MVPMLQHETVEAGAGSAQVIVEERLQVVQHVLEVLQTSSLKPSKRALDAVKMALQQVALQHFSQRLEACLRALVHELIVRERGHGGARLARQSIEKALFSRC